MASVDGLCAHFEAVRAAELARMKAKLAHLSPEDRAQVESLTHSLVRSLLQRPLQRLTPTPDARSASGSLQDRAAELFGLQNQAPGI
jgi:glutamyl-tRNA reductase